MKKVFFLLLLCAPVLFLTSCGEEDNGGSSDDVIGTWYGTRMYNNPVGGIKYQYLTITFYSDHTGNLEYEAPTSYSAASFYWTSRGANIICNGAYANTDGDLDSDFSLTLRRDGDRLIPENHYTIFILTRDNSVITDGNGNEVASAEDQYEMLQNVWIQNDAPNILVFYSNTYEEYVLPYKNASTYSSYHTGDYSFSPYNNHILIGTTPWEVKTLTKESLVLKGENRTVSYTRGSKSDIPSKTDISESIWGSWHTDGYSLEFGYRVGYSERSTKTYGVLGYIWLYANGSYSVSGNNIICDFSSVTWEGYRDGTANYFPGWTYGKPCTKTFMIEPIGEQIKVTLPNGKTIIMKKVG